MASCDGGCTQKPCKVYIIHTMYIHIFSKEIGHQVQMIRQVNLQLYRIHSKQAIHVQATCTLISVVTVIHWLLTFISDWMRSCVWAICHEFSPSVWPVCSQREWRWLVVPQKPWRFVILPGEWKFKLTSNLSIFLERRFVIRSLWQNG